MEAFKDEHFPTDTSSIWLLLGNSWIFEGPSWLNKWEFKNIREESMKKVYGLVLSALFILSLGSGWAKDSDKDTVYQFKVKTIVGKQFSLSKYNAKTLL